MVSVTGAVGETRVRRMKVVVGFESEEVPERGSDWEHPCEASRLAVFRGEWATLIASPVGCGKASGLGDSCILCKLSS